MTRIWDKTRATEQQAIRLMETKLDSTQLQDAITRELAQASDQIDRWLAMLTAVQNGGARGLSRRSKLVAR